MVTFAYVEPPAAPPIPAAGAWTRMPMRWKGWNGDVFPLTTPSAGLFLMPGVRGLTSPQHTRHSTESPALAGSRHLGHRVLDREVFWPLYLYSNIGSQDWVDWDGRFWETMHPDKPGVWTVRRPDGVERHLDVRFQSEEDTLNQDPSRFGWAKYAVTMLADRPFWYGESISRRFETRPPRPYYSGDDPEAPAGAVHFISSSGDLASARISNPGDLPAYPVWTVVGPTTTVTVGFEGELINIPFEIPAGKAVRIDTDPADGQIAWYGDWVAIPNSNGQFELLNQVDRTPELSAASSFATIPAGDGRQLQLAMSGTGAVVVDITPRYRGAWR